MSARSGSYATRSTTEGIEELSKKLTLDLKKTIRQLKYCEILSADWRDTANSLARIANVTDMEKTLPRTSEEATLWEGEELALRYLLEDGKLNLLLRMLDDYWTFRSSDRVLTEEEFAVCDKFEQGLCILLANAWTHVEAVQVCDLPLVVKIVGDVLRHCSKGTGESLYQRRLPVMVFYLLLQLGRFFDRLDEASILRMVRDARVMQNAAVHLYNNHPRMTGHDVEAAAEALAYMIDSEDASVLKTELLADPEVVAQYAKLDDAFLAALAGEYATRRKIRPLLDFVAACGRKL